MPLHLTVRLPWHDRGWDGHICNDPVKNTYCAGNRSCAGETIQKYKSKSIEEEVKYQGKHCSDVRDYIPPCSQHINTFSKRPVKHRHIPPDWLISKTKPAYDIVMPHTVGTWPYREVATFGDRTEGSWL